MLHRRSKLLRAAVPAAPPALALTACGSDDSSYDDNGQGDKGGSSQQEDGSFDADDSGESSAKSEHDGADGSGGPYKLGETADGSHEANDKGAVRVTVERGKNSDLTGAGLKSSDVKGQYPVFVHFKYQVEKMDKPQTSPNFNVNARVVGKGDEQAKKLLTIGADTINGGCPEKDDAEVKKGSTVTECSIPLLPEGTDVDQVAWAEDTQNPLIWNAAS